MRNPIMVLKALSEKSSDKSYKFTRLYRNLYNPEFYFLAYKNIYANKGSMTPGIDGTTMDNMSLSRIEKIISSIKDHSYQPNPARREYIEKKNSNKKRPLGIPSSDDKLVQEVVRMILESIYEPNFSPFSHGFRPDKCCHSALNQITYTFTGTKWFIEGDIKACFDSFNHQVTIDLLRKRIDDEYFIALMWKFLRNGYMEQWVYHQTYDGTPQGSGVSPILANIYLSELDAFIANYKENFDCGNNNNMNPEYKRLTRRIEKIKRDNGSSWKSMVKHEKNAVIKQVKFINKKRFSIPYKSEGNVKYKRLQYSRYADDFILGIIGSQKDAEKIKSDIKNFIKDKLKLELSEEKTKITHGHDMARYLGFDITISDSNDLKENKNGVKQRIYKGKVKLYVPYEKWFAKLQEYKVFQIEKDENGKEKWTPIHRGWLVNSKDIDIISKYNSEIRGLYNYYCIANNASVISNFAFIMEYSMYKTFGCKYKLSVKKVIAKFSVNGVFGITYPTKSGMKRCELYNKKFEYKRGEEISYASVLPLYQKYDNPNSLKIRLQLGLCEMCSIKTDDIRMHQVPKLKDLKGDSDWEKLMLKKHRKTLAVCPACHEMIHV